jgi:NAD-dependent SIR2 family protein deacetylase
MRKEILNNRVLIVKACERCGADFKFDQTYLQRETFDNTRCKDCKSLPVKQVYYGSEACRPWQGHYDEDDNPIKDGKLYKPGVRICGHKDCVRQDHIIPSESHTDRTASSVQGASTSSPNGPQRKSA